MQDVCTRRSLSTAEYKVPCCSLRTFSCEPLPDYCMSVPRWWELAQFISKKCDSVCTDWMKVNVVDCIVLSGAHLLAVTSLGDSPTASTQRDVRLSLLFGLYPTVHNASPHTVCVGVYIYCTCSLPCSPVGLHLLAAVEGWLLDGLLALASH